MGDTVYSYLGADIRNRSKKTPTPRDKCVPVLQKVTYSVVKTPVQIAQKDLDRLTKNLDKKVWGEGPPIVPAPPAGRIQQLLTVIPDLKVGEENPAQIRASEKTGVFTTKQLKCRRIDAEKDIQGDKIIIGGKTRPGDTTLDQELTQVADLENQYEEASIQPGDIETIIGVIIAILIGIVVIAVIAFYVLRGTYVKYEDVVTGPFDKVKAIAKPTVNLIERIKAWIINFIYCAFGGKASSAPSAPSTTSAPSAPP